MSFFESQVQKPTSPTVYLSPVLLANMENTPYCRLSPLKRAPQLARAAQPKITSSSHPPVAQELTLSKISTPLSTDRNFQDALFANLKGHFSNRIRVVRKGDLVAIPIDEDLSRTLYEPSASDETQELLSNSALGSTNSTRQSKLSGVGWFKIVYVGIAKEAAEALDEEDIWGGAASINSFVTKMMQSGSANSRIPGTMDNTWEYYLGLKSVPKSDASTTSMPEAPRHYSSATPKRTCRGSYKPSSYPSSTSASCHSFDLHAAKYWEGYIGVESMRRYWCTYLQYRCL